MKPVTRPLRMVLQQLCRVSDKKIKTNCSCHQLPSQAFRFAPLRSFLPALSYQFKIGLPQVHTDLLNIEICQMLKKYAWTAMKRYRLPSVIDIFLANATKRLFLRIHLFEISRVVYAFVCFVLLWVLYSPQVVFNKLTCCIPAQFSFSRASV